MTSVKPHAISGRDITPILISTPSEKIKSFTNTFFNTTINIYFNVFQGNLTIPDENTNYLTRPSFSNENLVNRKNKRFNQHMEKIQSAAGYVLE